MTAAHLILVWEERDDPNLLGMPSAPSSVGRNPRIVEYESVVRAERVVLRVGSSGPSRARRPRRVSWGSAPPFSLGVEEELFLVDAETLETAPVFEQVVPEPGRPSQARALRLYRRDDDADLPRPRGGARGARAAAGGRPRTGGRGRGDGDRRRHAPARAGRGSTARPAAALQTPARRSWRGAVQAARLRPSRPRRAARCGHGAARLRGGRPVAAHAAGALRQLARSRKGRRPGCARRAPNGCWRCRRGGRRRCSPTGTRGSRRRRATRRDGTGTRGRGLSTARSRCASWISRRTSGARRASQRSSGALVAAVADVEPEPYDRELYARRRADAARLPPDSPR